MTDPPHPWRRLATSWPDVPVLRADLGSPFLHAQTRWRGGRPVAVVLHERLTQVQARCAVAHECEHLDRGAPHEPFRAFEEQQVVMATARYLLPDLSTVIAALRCGDPYQAAADLWVTYPVIRDRLRLLTETERRHLDDGIDGSVAKQVGNPPCVRL